MRNLMLGNVALICGLTLVGCASNNNDDGGAGGTEATGGTDGTGATGGVDGTGAAGGVDGTGAAGGTAGTPGGGAAGDLGGGAAGVLVGGAAGNPGVVPGELGEACGDTTPCAEGLMCEAELCAAIPAELGEACGDTTPCAGLLTCDDGTCAAIPAGVDESCDDVVPCTGLLTCNAGTCEIVPAEVGDLCDDQVECVTGLACFSGICVHAGTVNVTLTWTDSTADLDLHVLTESGEIWLESPDVGGGILDVDDCSAGKNHAYDCRAPAGDHVENVYFETPTNGDYSAWVVNFRSESVDPVAYSLTIQIAGDDPVVVTGSLASGAAGEATPFVY